MGCQSGGCDNAPVSPAPGPAPANRGSGTFFTVIGQAGVPAMHAALMPNGKVVFIDKVEDYSQLRVSETGRFAYSSEFDPNTVGPSHICNSSRPTRLSHFLDRVESYLFAFSPTHSAQEAHFCKSQTPVYCDCGGLLYIAVPHTDLTCSADGRLLNVGGNGPLDFLDPTVTDGLDALRYLQRSWSSADLDGQNWLEPGNKVTPRHISLMMVNFRLMLNTRAKTSWPLLDGMPLFKHFLMAEYSSLPVLVMASTPLFQATTTLHMRF